MKEKHLMENKPMAWHSALNPAWSRWLLLWLALACSSGMIQAASSLAVLDFKVENPSAVAGERVAGLEDFFEVALQKQDMPVLERRNIRLILAERAWHNGGMLSAETLSQAKLPAVDYFLDGTVAFPSAGEFTLTISIIRSDKSTVEASLIRRGNYPEDWLPAIESLAKETGQKLQLPKRPISERSEFEMMTWLPEAALPFFKGLDYFSRGDYAAAVPWFRHSYEKDRHFDLARHWEARAYEKSGLPQLAKAVAARDTNAATDAKGLKRLVVAVVASDNVPAAGRAAFVQALANDGQFELFDPAAIGATAREIDLQLTGQMATPINERSVWLVVDDLIYLDAPEAETITARQQNLLSGETVRQARAQMAGGDEKSFTALVRSFLKNRTEATAVSSANEDPQARPEPARTEPADSAFPKALRLVQTEPDSARRWIGLADYYADYQFKGICLDEAIKAIGRKREQPDAAFWLASALWRKREMSSRVFYEPTAFWHASNPLTNDFAQLLQWFPKSAEAAALLEVTNHGEGSYRYVEPADRRYLSVVYTNLHYNPPPEKTTRTVTATANFTGDQPLNRLAELLKNGRLAPAWQLANDLNQSDNASVKSQVQAALSDLSQTCRREARQFQDFSSAIAAGNEPQALALGRDLSKCIDRRQRAEVINRCAEIIKKQKGSNEQLKYLFSQARLYREDFLINPVTGLPGNRCEYQWMENFIAGMRVISPDYGYEPLMGTVAEIAHDQPPSDLTREIIDYIRNDPVLSREKRLTAVYDLAMLEQAQGHTFEALDLLKDILRQTEGTGLPLRRNSTWSQSIESAAFDALRKIRVYAGAEVDVCNFCGKIPDEPPQKPANYEEVNRKLARLWKQQIGEAGTTNPPIDQQLLAGKEDFFPVILYKLRTGEEVSHTLIFCSDLGTNSLPALPVILQIIHRGEPFQDYNNALMALGALGHAAGCAKPLLILARENADNGNFNYALKCIGPAPRRVMPQLAQLLYHKNPVICQLAAQAMMETAALDRKQFKGHSDEQQVTSVRQWWEEAGISQQWGW